MAERTSIEWCDHTFNPWEGCQKVGPGCEHCYAESRNARFGGGVAVNWGPGAPRRRTGASNWNLPLRWNAAHEAFFAEHGRRQRVFCASLADVFDNQADPEWRADLFELIAATPNLDWLLLTKRIGNVHRMIDLTMDALDLRQQRGTAKVVRGPWPWSNLWLGATIVNQEEADRYIPKLLDVPARVRFLSMEPLLGPVDLTHLNEGSEENEIDALKPHTWDAEVEAWRDSAEEWEEDFEDWFGRSPREVAGPTHPGINWVIVGGESGPGARPMHPEWVRSLRDQCKAADVPFLFKQWGEWCTAEQLPDRTGDSLYSEDLSRLRHQYIALGRDGLTAHDAQLVEPSAVAIHRVGKKAAGRLLDGRTHDGAPS